MTSRPPLLVRTLNAALGLDLADISDAREFLRSDEGNALLDAWLAAHPDDEIPETAPLVGQDETAPTGRTTR